jgi:hypothetical protein
MSWLAFNVRRELAAEAAEPLPDAWAMAAEAIEAELARRTRERDRGLPPQPLRGLSDTAITVLAFLHALEHGRTYVERLRKRIASAPVAVDVVSGLDELHEHGLITISWATDEDGRAAEPIVTLIYQAALPDPPAEGEE